MKPRRILRRLGEAIEGRGNRKVAKLRERANGISAAVARHQGVYNIIASSAPSHSAEGQLRALEHQHMMAREAEKTASKLRRKADRIEKRYTSGWVGKLTRRLKK